MRKKNEKRFLNTAIRVTTYNGAFRYAFNAINVNNLRKVDNR